MPNHVHLIAIPPSEKALSQAIGEAHRRYARCVNFREAGEDTYGKDVLPLFQWTKLICT